MIEFSQVDIPVINKDCNVHLLILLPKIIYNEDLDVMHLVLRHKSM